MELEKKINDDLKDAMRAKDSRKLDALRAIKAALLLEKTGKDVSSGEIPDSVELKLLQKLVKQRKEAAAIYTEQHRPELAEEELYQADIIQAYLPEKLSEAEIKSIIKEIISETGATSIKEMGRIMGLASSRIAGQAENTTIAQIVKEILGH
ncbi:MAG: GatB/YqeY domain-containing protein [Bacteroidales bacterium]|nr:GatB/YqeY domain-containing protein [Bacteroidales bacterium]MDP2237748.1 GatB/YqeY domain-containing protein [Bacteroidales bacterium]